MACWASPTLEGQETPAWEHQKVNWKEQPWKRPDLFLNHSPVLGSRGHPINGEKDAGRELSALKEWCFKQGPIASCSVSGWDAFSMRNQRFQPSDVEGCHQHGSVSSSSIARGWPQSQKPAKIMLQRFLPLVKLNFKGKKKISDLANLHANRKERRLLLSKYLNPSKFPALQGPH